MQKLKLYLKKHVKQSNAVLYKLTARVNVLCTMLREKKALFRGSGQ